MASAVVAMVKIRRIFCPPHVSAVAVDSHAKHSMRAAVGAAPKSLHLPASVAEAAAMTSTDFYRIRRLPPYVFAEVNAMKAAARARGEDIVDLGMGNPDGAPPAHVIEKLAEVARNPRAHRYSASKGIAGLRKAQAGYYA